VDFVKQPAIQNNEEINRKARSRKSGEEKLKLRTAWEKRSCVWQDFAHGYGQGEASLKR
jgi:hypothetical protein